MYVLFPEMGVAGGRTYNVREGAPLCQLYDGTPQSLRCDNNDTAADCDDGYRFTPTKIIKHVTTTNINNNFHRWIDPM
jgi:hypothetical protein